MSRLILLLVLSSSLTAQALPSPGEHLGYDLGSRFTLHANLVAYARLAAERSDRVTLTEYGRTAEGRPLLYLVVTSPKNHARMDEIRAAKAKIADPRRLADGEDAAALINTAPVVVWLSYNVHGNEPSPSEAAMNVIHRLTTAGDDETTKWLDEAITIIDPCINPDGRDRYAYWYNGVKGRQPDADPQSMEHREPWPGGRSNHWYFDLNRDWAFVTQAETRSRLPHFVAWTPQVHVDFHEMGFESNYFFFPAEKPINANLPEHTLKWGERFGRGNARAFDERGWGYYTAESFDLFYPGYGDSWPSFSGAIGMTYEQGGHSRAGAAVRRRDRTVLTLKQRLEHHEVASYATIRTAVEGRREFMGDYQQFRASAVEEGRTGPIRSFLLPLGSDPGRVDALVNTLLLQGIEVRRTDAPVTLPKVTDALGKEQLDRTFDTGTYVIDLAQPLKRLAKTLLEPRAEIRELFFYDVSAWSLPLAYGVSAFQSPVEVGVPTSTVETVGTRPGRVAPGEAKVAWLCAYDTRGGLEALVDLLRSGVKVRSARKAFTLDGRSHERGTLVIRRSENSPHIGDRLEAIAKARGVTFHPAASGFTEKGIDLGSQSIAPVVRPRIALCGGEGTSGTSFGATRFILDQVLDVPYSYVPLKSLADLDLDDFTVVVVPEASVSAEARKKLSSFASSGGIVVGFGRAAFSLCGEGGSSISHKTKEKAKEGSKEAKEEPRPKWTEDREAHRRKRQQPGSIFRVELDPAHPLSFGYRAEIAAFHGSTRSFNPKGPGTHVGLFVEADPISGYVNTEHSKALQGRAYLSVEGRGRGAFVLFADDPNFRGAWRGLTRLFLNATLLMPSKHLKN